MTDNKDYDCCIVGGGMVGAALAIGLAKLNKKVVIIERYSLHEFDVNQPPDLRMSAFNLHSVELLKDLGAWQYIQEMRMRSYTKLSVWDANPFFTNKDLNFTSFDAEEANQTVLGYFIENRLVQLALHKVLKIDFSEQVEIVYEQPIQHIDCLSGRVELNNNRTIKCSAIFGADGANSKVRSFAKIGTSGWQYSQHANGILIEADSPFPDETWQAFYTSGPRALLPMYDNFACLVWYDSKEKSDWIQQASNEELKQAVLEHFPSKLPEFNVVNKASFPLTRMHAKKYGQHKAIILGDAAHTINPLAGQGVNIGLKDVASLIEIVGTIDFNDLNEVVKKFEKSRYAQNLLMMSTMDALYFTFSTELTPIKAIRDLGLTVAQRAGVAKGKALKYAMGI